MAELSRVKFTEAAERDLSGIFDWIANDSSTDRARIIATRICLTIGQVALLPGIGRFRHDLTGQPQEFPITPWLMFYRTNDEGGGITVLRVLDGRRDVLNVLETEDRR
jgi:plasmid stabilization system protein ParE